MPVLEIMKQRFQNAEEKEKQAVLAFDEMSIKKVIEYSDASKVVYGPCSKATVVLVRGLLSSWKQVVFFQFDCPMTRNLLFFIINQVESIGVKIRAVTADQGNPTVQFEMGLSLNNSFQNPASFMRKVYWFAGNVVGLFNIHFVISSCYFPNT